MITVECCGVHTKFESATLDFFFKTFLILIKIIKSICLKIMFMIIKLIMLLKFKGVFLFTVLQVSRVNTFYYV